MHGGGVGADGDGRRLLSPSRLQCGTQALEQGDRAEVVHGGDRAAGPRARTGQAREGDDAVDGAVGVLVHGLDGVGASVFGSEVEGGVGVADVDADDLVPVRFQPRFRRGAHAGRAAGYDVRVHRCAAFGGCP